MCGIAGQFNYNNENNDIYKDVLEIMQQTMNRRGPDQNGIYMEKNILSPIFWAEEIKEYKVFSNI